jgi:hypothetical protein
MEINYMYEEKSFLSEIEYALHERTEGELLMFMNTNINDVLSKMNLLKSTIQTDLGAGSHAFDEVTGRMYYVYSLFINLWNCRN